MTRIMALTVRTAIPPIRGAAWINFFDNFRRIEDPIGEDPDSMTLRGDLIHLSSLLYARLVRIRIRPLFGACWG